MNSPMAALSHDAAAPAGRAEAWRHALPALLLLLVCTVVAQFESFRAMVLIWERSETFAHAFVVPPIALWLIWRQRAALRVQVPRPAGLLLLGLVICGVAWLPGQLVAVNAITQTSATAMLVAAVPLVLGWRVAAVILFPLLYLFFAVPIGEFMIPPLMQATADFTVGALRVSGVPVYREGLQFVIPSGSWSVVEACSGVRYLMASFMVGSLFAYLNYRSWRRRLVFGIVSLLVPIVANWLRAYMIVMLGHLSGNKLAVGADHLIYGWVFFGVVITIVFMIGARWAEDPLPAPVEPSGAALSARVPVQAWRFWLIAALGSVLVSVPVLVAQRIDAAESNVPPRLGLVLSETTGWHQQADAPVLWKPVFVEPSAELAAHLIGSDRPAVDLYLAYYRHQSEERKLVGSGNVIVTSKDKVWNAIESGEKELQIGDRRLTVYRTRLLHAETPGSAQRMVRVVWRLYWVNGTITHDEHWAKAAGAWHRLRGEGDESAAIVVSALDAAGAPADVALESFVRENLSMVERGLKATRDAR